MIHRDIAPDGTDGMVLMTTFVDDPIVPLELRLPSGLRTLLYQPGYYTADDGSTAFLGVPGERVFGFDSLAELATHVGAAGGDGLAASRHFQAMRSWTAKDYFDKLCSYDFTRLAELVDGELDEDEQAAFGSTLALMLDLLDFLEIEDRHADALRDDEDLSKLASGDEVLAIFTASRHRRHVVDVIKEHWAPCVTVVDEHIGPPR